MKAGNKTIALLLVFALVCVAANVAAKPRVLPPNAYISTAKIEILSGEEERLGIAVAMLDSLLMNYGPHAEGLYWMTMINVDLIEKRSNLHDKKPYVEKMVAYTDSIHQCCESDDIKKKYKRKCKEHINELDSINVYYWRTYYNNGVKQLNEIIQKSEEIARETDSAAIEYFKNTRLALLDSCKSNMSLAIIIDSANHKPYLGLSSAYQKSDEIDSAMIWLDKAAARTDDAAVQRQILLQQAYGYISLGDYASAIKPFKQYVDVTASDSLFISHPDNLASLVSNMYNLTVCYNNNDFYDSANMINKRILELDASNYDAMMGVGRFFNEMARRANDSANFYRKAENTEMQDHWRGESQRIFDSSVVYFQNGLATAKSKKESVDPSEAAEWSKRAKDAAENLGIVAYVGQKFEVAVEAFDAAVAEDPSDADNWISLGDASLNLQQFDKAAEAYEHVIELKPDDKDVLERLRDIYKQLNNKAKAAEIDEKLKSM